ncbi:MAG: NUDIX domain-containing protein [Candidatus Woesearchaeota archaeon]
MSEEIIDIVDENDNIIGQDTKKNAHTLGKLHRCAGFFIFKEESFKNVLVQKSKKDGKYRFPGGHLLVGETYLHGGLRELHEEMLVDKWLPDVEITPLFRFKVLDSKEFVLAYRMVYFGPFSLNHEEVEEYFFVDIKELFSRVEKDPSSYIYIKPALEEYKKRGYVK